MITLSNRNTRQRKNHHRRGMDTIKIDQGVEKATSYKQDGVPGKLVVSGFNYTIHHRLFSQARSLSFHYT